MVERACLENRCALTGTEGSNPSLSARYKRMIKSPLVLKIIAIGVVGLLTFASVIVKEHSLRSQDEKPLVAEVKVPPATIPPENLVTKELTEPEVKPSCAVFDDFESLEKGPSWFILNDNVMGGRSAGEYEITQGQLRFFGRTNTNGGGFASVRVKLPAGILTEVQTVELTARGDGRTYALSFRDQSSWRVSHQKKFSAGEVPITRTFDL